MAHVSVHVSGSVSARGGTETLSLVESPGPRSTFSNTLPQDPQRPKHHGEFPFNRSDGLGWAFGDALSKAKGRVFMEIFKYMEKYDYEQLVFCQDEASGLKAIIAIHDTTLGPALGGARMWTYASEENAIEDALRLARGMTYKNAAAGLNLGGGKTVIIGDPFKDKNETPYELWKGHTPNLNYFRVWGCLAKVGIPEPKRKKIGPKTVDAIFVGYSLDSNTYRFLVINSEISEITNNTLIESRDATFFENIFPFKNQIQSSISNEMCLAPLYSLISINPNYDVIIN